MFDSLNIAITAMLDRRHCGGKISPDLVVAHQKPKECELCMHRICTVT
jgi:hypothetical protein